MRGSPVPDAVAHQAGMQLGDYLAATEVEIFLLLRRQGCESSSKGGLLCSLSMGTQGSDMSITCKYTVDYCINSPLRSSLGGFTSPIMAYQSHVDFAPHVFKRSYFPFDTSRHMTCKVSKSNLEGLCNQ